MAPESRMGTRRVALGIGLLVIAMAVALGFLIASLAGDVQPPDDVPRAIALPMLYAAAGLLALIGAAQRRPAVVIASGVLCLTGAILSVATIVFAAPGVALLMLGSRIRRTMPSRGPQEAATAVGACLLVLAAAVSLLTMTEARCWAASGSPANPTYSSMACGSDGGVTVPPVGGQSFASGYSSAVLTVRGGLVEAVLLVAAITLVVVTGRRDRPSTQESVPQGGLDDDGRTARLS